LINVDEIIAAATAEAGLSTLEDPAILEGLGVYVQALNTEAQLTERGEQSMRKWMVDTLVNRLKVDDHLARHPELLARPIDKPMFVFGLPRTGTTLAINLLHADPARRSALRWEVLDSVPPPKAETLSSDPRYQREQARLEMTIKHAPHIAAIHYEDADSPTECQFIMSQSFCAQVFEAQANVPSYRRWFLDADYAAAFRYHKRFLQLLQSEAPGRWTLKNPWHPLFLDDLTAVYPDAQLVMTHRDPAEVVGSACSLIRHVRAMFSESVDLRQIGVEMIDTFDQMIARQEAFRAKHGRGAIYDLGYRALTADPIGEMQKLYRHFDEPLTPQAEAAMSAYLASNAQGKHGKHAYTLEEFGLTKAGVRDHFAAYIGDYDILERA
jgi:sulfotransferase family protein